MPKHAAIRGPKPLAPKRRARKHIINRAPAPSWISGWRERIETSKLITRLQTFALANPDDPTSPRMTRTQAQVALSLLRKVLPDMQSLEIKGNTDQPITVQVLRFSDPVAPHSNGALSGPALAEDALLQPLTIDVEAKLIEDEPKPRKRRTHSQQ